MIRRAPWLVAVLLALCVSSAVVADVAADLAGLLAKGRYDEVIAAATQELEKTDPPDKQLVYLRGMAAFYIQWYGVAQKDMSSLGDYAPWEKWPPASDFAGRVVRIKAVAPANVDEIRRGKTCLFRIYYDENNEWSQAIAATLRETYAEVCGLYGAELAETSVFIFSDGARYNEFFRLGSGSPPTDWQWAAGAGGALLFCQYDADGSQPVPPGSAYMRSSIAHEFSHCLVRRYLGTTRIPPWLDEGLATCCGALLVPEDLARNDLQVAAIVRLGQMLPLSVMAESRGFYSNDNAKTAYPQGFAMVRFMADQIGRDGLLKLLQLLRDEGDLDKALDKGWQTNSTAVYEAWHDGMLRLLQEGKLGP
ncbi:MAG: hypothetical protein FJX75_26335 [Armatimonadetes bacterium]|nr:hypothetical protein [Armatimonadota bacterium]